MSALDTVMQREMTRKEFLITLGLAIASLMGFSSIIKLFLGKSFDAHTRGRPGAYGH